MERGLLPREGGNGAVRHFSPVDARELEGAWGELESGDAGYDRAVWLMSRWDGMIDKFVVGVTMNLDAYCRCAISILDVPCSSSTIRHQGPHILNQLSHPRLRYNIAIFE